MFVLLAVVPTEERRMRWPIILAGVLGILGVLFAIGTVEILNALDYVWPVGLILRASGSRRRPRPHASISSERKTS